MNNVIGLVVWNISFVSMGVRFETYFTQWYWFFKEINKKIKHHRAIGFEPGPFDNTYGSSRLIYKQIYKKTISLRKVSKSI
jgi:hypothetical protein